MHAIFCRLKGTYLNIERKFKKKKKRKKNGEKNQPEKIEPKESRTVNRLEREQRIREREDMYRTYTYVQQATSRLIVCQRRLDRQLVQTLCEPRNSRISSFFPVSHSQFSKRAFNNRSLYFVRTELRNRISSFVNVRRYQRLVRQITVVIVIELNLGKGLQQQPKIKTEPKFW